jgi:nitroreductase
MKIEITLETLEAAVEACHTAALHADAAAAEYAVRTRPEMCADEQAALQRLVAQQQQAAAAYRATAAALTSARAAAAEEVGRNMARKGGSAQ